MMKLRTECRSIILKLLPGITYLVFALICLSKISYGRVETYQGALSAQLSAGNKTAVSPQAEEQLDSDKTIERELAKGDRHAYRVMLSANQFLRVVVSQQGIDVVVQLFAPDSKKVMTMDSPNGLEGPETILVIAQTDGIYRIEIECPDKSASGRYQIKIEELRTATAKDSKSVAAWLALLEADSLSRKGTSEAYRSALLKYDEALSLMVDTDDNRGKAYALYGLGFAYHALDENQKTLEHHIPALEILQAIGEQWAVASLLSNIGLAYGSIAEYQKALEHHNQALSLFQSLRSTWGEATSLNNIGLIYDSLGEHQKALDYYNQALPLRQVVGDRTGQAITLNNIGASYRSLGDYQKALDYYNRALPILKAGKSQRIEAFTLNNIGIVYTALGEHQKALDYYRRAQALGERRSQAVALKNMGMAYTVLGDNQKAIDCYNQSLQLSLISNDRNLESVTRYLMARQQYSQNNLIEARSNIETALEIAESLRAKVISPELRASYFSSAQQYYDLYIDLLMRFDQLNPNQGYQELALNASERARARTLLEMLAEARADIRQGVEPSLLERELSLKRALDAKTERQSRLLSLNGNQKEIELIEKEIKQLLVEDQQIKAQIKEKSPRYAALTQPRPLTLKEIQQKIVDPDTLLLEYALGEEHSYLWAVTQNSIATFQLPKRAEIEKAAQRVYDLLSVDNRQKRKPSAKFYNDYNDAVSALSRIVLEPVAMHLQKQRLLIVTHGALSYIPFAVLPSPEICKPPTLPTGHSTSQPLITKHEIIYLPSVSILAVLRRESAGRKSGAKAVAVIADPVFDKKDVRVRAIMKEKKKVVAGKNEQEDKADLHPDNISQIAFKRSISEVGLGNGKELQRLPFSGQEARAIFSLSQHAGAMSALDFEASLETATSAEMKQYRIVHFATHSILNNEHPELSGLVLSLVDKQGNPQNGFLRLYNIYNLNLEADLVVLSACQTALGKQIKGEGLMGVTRGFMYAGAARVVASLWKVDDEATAELMKRFYTEMMKEGHRPAEALRAAQLWMQKQERWQSPYYWAGFILQGEWR
jgi:CHAT domain-containing protein/Tfp pilus assembly protein PilF